jgi:hypothetical protein
MVHTELRSPDVDRDHETVAWVAVASLRVRGDEYELDDPDGVLDLTLPVLNLRTGRNLRFEEDREEWARGLPSVYRGPELIAAIIDDDNPIPETDAAVEREPINIPETAAHHAVR